MLVVPTDQRIINGGQNGSAAQVFERSNARGCDREFPIPGREGAPLL